MELTFQLFFARARVKEIPVEWRETGGTRVKLMNYSTSMGSQILKLWWDLRKEPSVQALTEDSRTRHVTIVGGC